MSDRLAYNLAEAAKLVGCSVDTLRREIKRTDEKRLPAKLRGGRYLIRRNDLDDWLDRLEDT
jgi:excisionase family DNA binding protein